jgi:hypothetical protein
MSPEQSKKKPYQEPKVRSMRILIRNFMTCPPPPQAPPPPHR